MTRPVIRASDALGDGALDFPSLERRQAPLLPPREPPAALLADYEEALRAEGLDREELAEALQGAASRWRWRYRTGGRVCTGCGDRKPLSAYGSHPLTPDGAQPRCRECEAAGARQRRTRKRAEAAAIS